MNIDICRCSSDHTRVSKTWTVLNSEPINARIKENTSVVDPVFILDDPGTLNFNYIVCPSTSRKYYVRDIEMMTGGRVAVHCHCDVLTSFASGIRSCEAIINKQNEDPKTSPYINDGSYVTLCKKVIQTYTFPQGFSACNNIIITAGGN